MAESTVKRQDHVTGDNFVVFNDGIGGPNSQGVTLCDEFGNPLSEQPISAASLPLPTGAAKESKQQTDTLTDTQLRAAAVPVSGPLTDTELRAASVPVSGPLTDAELRATDVPVSGPLTDSELRASRVLISTAQEKDNNNSKTIAAADASPGSPWVGAWTQTRSLGVVRQLVVLAASDTTIGGTFTFEYGEDGATALISEARTIGDFEEVRDFDLLNAGEYFRIKFEPSAPLGSELVFATTTNRFTNDGAFVRLAGQEIEEANAAMPQNFSYIKAFVQLPTS